MDEIAQRHMNEFSALYAKFYDDMCDAHSAARAAEVVYNRIADERQCQYRSIIDQLRADATRTPVEQQRAS